jgi:hypothetical protein
MILRTEGDCRCKQIRCFKAIYKQWICAVTELAKQWKRAGDVPWWYNERASLSVFAGAIWRAGGHCFEEYSEEKREFRRRSHRLGKDYPGRVDLYFSWRGFDFIAEAKDTYSCFTRGNKSADARLKHYLEMAREDIKQSKPDGQRRLAILFARPCFRKRAEADIERLLQIWVENLADLDLTSYAWVFPRCARHTYGKDGWCCPGEAVLLREVWR